MKIVANINRMCCMKRSNHRDQKSSSALVQNSGTYTPIEWMPAILRYSSPATTEPAPGTSRPASPPKSELQRHSWPETESLCQSVYGIRRQNINFVYTASMA